ncbi:MAG: AAA family ATPase [Deltaproteobacteria bacterium]|jgi:hypothetical protein|nr:AAA family ATPase [Deltaproteobacteria bacterium]
MNITTDSAFFKGIREGDFLYVDKTGYIHSLINSNRKLFFLQRPRRFGKTLLINTMTSIFNGESHLFDGLKIKTLEYDFIKYPTLLFNFHYLANKSPDLLELDLYNQICKKALEFNVPSVENEVKSISTALTDLAKGLIYKNGINPVILVDEYDGAILARLDEPKLAARNAKSLGIFFGSLKDLNDQGLLRLAFITGVSKFSMTSIFSGPNSYTDISEKKEYANICGITSNEFKIHLSSYLKEMFTNGRFKNTEFTYESFSDALVNMYDGYTWNFDDHVFNPFSLLRAIEECALDSYWYKSGTPTFLYRFIRDKPELALNLDDITVSVNDLQQQAADELSFIPLLYQTGYLTMNSASEDNKTLYLKIPNAEVEEAFNHLIARSYIGDKLTSLLQLGSTLLKALRENNLEELQNSMKELLLDLPIAPKYLNEKGFHLIVVVCLRMMGIKKIYSERKIEGGRPDIAFMLDETKGILLELKSFKSKHPESENDLEKEFLNILEKAALQMEKYYTPLFKLLNDAREIQGYAVAVSWGKGVRLKTTRHVTRSSLESDTATRTDS